MSGLLRSAVRRFAVAAAPQRGCLFAPSSSSSLSSSLSPSSSPLSLFLQSRGFCEMSANPKLFVAGLPWSTDDSALRDAFASFGAVTEARVITDRETGRSRGFGFVTFSSTSEAESALSMNGRDLDGRTLKVNYATERAPGMGRFGGGGGFGGGGYGGGGYGGDDSR